MAIGIVHITNSWGTNQGGHALEEKEQTEGVSELLRSEEISEHEGCQQDVGSAGGRIDVLICFFTVIALSVMCDSRVNDSS